WERANVKGLDCVQHRDPPGTVAFGLATVPHERTAERHDGDAWCDTAGMTPSSDVSAPSRRAEGHLRSVHHGTADARAAESGGAAHDRGPAGDHGTADARDTDAPGTADDLGACRAARGDDEFIGRAFIPREDGSVLGVGVDVVDIARLAGRIERTPALLERLFTPGERGLPSASRAARVAAKEAVGKALGAP